MDPAPVAPLHPPAPQPAAGHISSFDLLRGLCALGVALYHLLYWTKLGDPHNLGLYGVYAFFLLSGASISVAYARRLRRGYPITRYLALRYVRLAPLYAAVAAFSAYYHARASYGPVELVARWLLNVTFVFGLANPATTSLVVGGWSLGIEFVFYLAFPLLLAVVSARRGWMVVGALLVVQVIFVNLVLRGGDLAQVDERYTQFVAFVGYFAFGAWVGARRVDGGMAPFARQAPGWLGWLLLIALIATQSGADQRASLAGGRGALLLAASCVLLLVTVKLEVPSPLRALATWLGDLSYPLYLLHPVVYGVALHPRLLLGWFHAHPVRFLVIVLLISIALATAAYRWFEAPILRRGKRWLAA